MKSKNWLLAALLGVTMTAAACSDDSANKTKTVVDDPVVPEATYSLTCAAPVTCNLVLEANQAGQVRIQLSSLTNEEGAIPTLISKAAVTATMSGTGFTMQNDSGSGATLALETNPLGQATLKIQAGNEAGSGTITFATSEEFGGKSVVFNITVNAASIVDPPKPEDVVYNVKLSYSGTKDIKYGEVLYFAGKTCSNIVKEEMTSTEVVEVSGETDGAFGRVSTSVNDLSFDYTVKSDNTDVYAVFARGTNAGVGMAYGCTDGLGPDNKNITVTLNDAKITEVVDPDNPPGPGPIIPPGPDDPAKTLYEGTYPLTSQFNALSLLPHAETTSGSVPFNQMLLGDWIEFALKVLSNPEAAVPNILTQQLIPMLLNAEWFTKVIGSILGEGVASMLTPEVVANLFESLGGSLIIENFLNQLTSQLTWWDTATGSIDMVTNLVTNFTLRGAFDVPAGAQPDSSGNISNIRHRYLRVLYENGNFQKCYVGSTYGETADHKMICSIAISDLDENSNGAISGYFTGTFHDNTNPTVDISRHSLDLAYGRLIYGVITEFIPMITGTTDVANPPKTLGALIAHYAGAGLVKLWNEKYAESEDAKIPADKTGCPAIGAVAGKFLVQKLGNNETLGALIGMFANESTLGSLCTTGIAKLDDLIVSQLDKLSVAGESVSFESTGCNIIFDDSNPKYSRLITFGVPQVWGSTVADKRCNWNVSIATEKPVTIKGKFAAGE